MSRFLAVERPKAKADVKCEPSAATLAALAELACASTLADMMGLQGYMSATERRAWAGCYSWR